MTAQPVQLTRYGNGTVFLPEDLDAPAIAVTAKENSTGLYTLISRVVSPEPGQEIPIPNTHHADQSQPAHLFIITPLPGPKGPGSSPENQIAHDIREALRQKTTDGTNQRRRTQNPDTLRNLPAPDDPHLRKRALLGDHLPGPAGDGSPAGSGTTQARMPADQPVRSVACALVVPEILADVSGIAGWPEQVKAEWLAALSRPWSVCQPSNWSGGMVPEGTPSADVEAASPQWAEFRMVRTDPDSGVDDLSRPMIAGCHGRVRQSMEPSAVLPEFLLETGWPGAGAVALSGGYLDQSSTKALFSMVYGTAGDFQTGSSSSSGESVGSSEDHQVSPMARLPDFPDLEFDWLPWGVFSDRGYVEQESSTGRFRLTWFLDGVGIPESSAVSVEWRVAWRSSPQYPGTPEWSAWSPASLARLNALPPVPENLRLLEE